MMQSGKPSPGKNQPTNEADGKDKLKLAWVFWLLGWLVPLALMCGVALHDLIMRQGSQAGQAQCLLQTLALTNLTLVPSGRPHRNPEAQHPGIDLRHGPELFQPGMDLVQLVLTPLQSPSKKE